MPIYISEGRDGSKDLKINKETMWPFGNACPTVSS